MPWMLGLLQSKAAKAAAEAMKVVAAAPIEVAKATVEASVTAVQAAKPAQTVVRTDHYRGGRYDEQSVSSFRAAEATYGHIAKETADKAREKAKDGSGVYIPDGWGKDRRDGLMKDSDR